MNFVRRLKSPNSLRLSRVSRHSKLSAFVVNGNLTSDSATRIIQRSFALQSAQKTRLTHNSSSKNSGVADIISSSFYGTRTIRRSFFLQHQERLSALPAPGTRATRRGYVLIRPQRTRLPALPYKTPKSTGFNQDRHPSNICTRINNGEISCKGLGKSFGSKCLELELTNKTDKPIIVTIPKGTFFGNTAAQKAPLLTKWNESFTLPPKTTIRKIFDAYSGVAAYGVPVNNNMKPSPWVLSVTSALASQTALWSHVESASPSIRNEDNSLNYYKNNQKVFENFNNDKDKDSATFESDRLKVEKETGIGPDGTPIGEKADGEEGSKTGDQKTDN